jgi:hypothetical protein
VRCEGLLCRRGEEQFTLARPVAQAAHGGHGVAGSQRGSTPTSLSNTSRSSRPYAAWPNNHNSPISPRFNTDCRNVTSSSSHSAGTVGDSDSGSAVVTVLAGSFSQTHCRSRVTVR